jgi:hypothetical protein
MERWQLDIVNGIRLADGAHNGQVGEPTSEQQPNEQPSNEQRQDLSTSVVEQIFDLFITPELDRRGGLQLSDVRKALILLPSNGPPEVRLNEEAALVGEGRATRDIEAGEEITVDDISEITNLWPAGGPRQ